MDNSPWLAAIRKLFSPEVFAAVRALAEQHGAAVALDYVEQQIRGWRAARAGLVAQSSRRAA